MVFYRTLNSSITIISYSELSLIFSCFMIKVLKLFKLLLDSQYNI